MALPTAKALRGVVEESRASLMEKAEYYLEAALTDAAKGGKTEVVFSPYVLGEGEVNFPILDLLKEELIEGGFTVDMTTKRVFGKTSLEGKEMPALRIQF